MIASLVVMDGIYRLIVNEIQAEQTTEQGPHLLVAKILWKPEASLSEATDL